MDPDNKIERKSNSSVEGLQARGRLEKTDQLKEGIDFNQNQKSSMLKLVVIRKTSCNNDFRCKGRIEKQL